jgi:hypothetical protein
MPNTPPKTPTDSPIFLTLAAMLLSVFVGAVIFLALSWVGLGLSR